MHEDHRERMREKVRVSGLDGLFDHEILEFLLFYSIPRKDTNEIAHRLLKAYGSLNGVLDQSYDELLNVGGIGPHSALLLSTLSPLVRRLLRGAAGQRPKLNTAAAHGQYARSLLWGRSNEHFYMVCLDNRFGVLRDVLLSSGTVSEAAIYPRMVVENALRYKASFIVLAHNHPSGSIHPSRQDIQATQAILQALRPVGIDLLDHIIVAGDQLYSFTRQGLISVNDQDTDKAKYAADSPDNPEGPDAL